VDEQQKMNKRYHSLLPFASIVVCSYNSERTIDYCLKSLSQLRYGGKYEIIVIDSTLVDSVRRIANNHEATYYWTPPRGYSEARNLGIEKSKGEIVAFTDSDCVADINWLTNLVKGFSDKDIAGVGGVVSGGAHFQPAWVTDNHGRLDFQKNLSMGWSHKRFPFPFLCTANCAYRKQVLEKIGGFPKQFGVGERGIGGEDVEISLRIQKKGYRLKIVNNAKIFHQPISANRKLENTFKEGRYAYILTKVHKTTTLRQTFLTLLMFSIRYPIKILALLGFVYEAACHR